ncbi:MAG: bifunctional demethylmenaquinone methyltransferase/2-methoxy-6-polyprenyl-1,4-benzoquinol methylase UbiE [Candidatus Limimorpha sp.]
MDTDKDKIAAMFDDIAPTYDRLNHILSVNVDKIWRRKAVKRLSKSLKDIDKPKILDVACGTADSTVLLADKIKNSHIDGIDISDGMLGIGRDKIKKKKLDDKVSLYRSAAEHIVCQDDVYDAVFLAFGVRNFSDRRKGLEELFRIMKPGATLIILELSEPQNKVIRGLYDIYFKKVLPFIGKHVSGNGGAYRYLQKSVEKFPMPDEFMPFLESCGYHNIHHFALTLGLCRIYQAQKK